MYGYVQIPDLVLQKHSNTKPFYIFLQPKVESTHSLKDSVVMLAKLYFWQRGLRRDVQRGLM